MSRRVRGTVSAVWRGFGMVTYLVLRGLFRVARAVAGIDRALREGIGGAGTALARAFAQALAHLHRGSAQDMTLMDLAGLALLLVGRLFGS